MDEPTYTGTTVLYVEDQPEHSMLMQAIFEARPALRLVVALHGAQAMELAPSLRPDLLLIDQRLPDGSGADLLARLRPLPGWGGVPAIAVTGDDAFSPTGTGFCEVWVKPLDISHVLSRLDRLLKLEEATPASL